MNRLSKTLAPIAAIAILGSSAAPAFAADGNMQGNAQSSTVSLYSAESTLPAAVTAPSDSNARVITTLADATAAAQVAKDAPQTETKSTTIEDALREKFSQKEGEKHDAEVKAQTEKAQAEAEKKADAKRKADAKKVASIVKRDAGSNNEAATVPVAAPASDVDTDASGTYNVDADVDVDDSDDEFVDASSYDPTNDGSTIETPSYAYSDGGTYTPTPVYGGGDVETQAVSTHRSSAPAKKPVKRAAVKHSASTTTNQKIYKAAMAQLGKRQDCTMLVTNSLKSVGINYHDWPAGYKKLGKAVPRSQAKAGDLIYYRNGGMGLAHIAVYAGNGKAVHGGWNGNQTVLQTANVGYGAEYIRVSR